MAKKRKFYVVWEGHNPGIYDSWGATQQEINGYSGAKYKSFSSQSEAEDAFYSGSQEHFSLKKSSNPVTRNLQDYSRDILPNSFSVDAACSGNPGATEYRGVYVWTGEELFKKGPFAMGTNNLGEFLGLVHALALFKGTSLETMSIYTDSRTAMAWIRNRKVKTQLKKTKRNEPIFRLVARAENWVKENEWKNPVLKWETKVWGEIPADFGRK